MIPHLIPPKLIRFCALFLPLLLTFAGFQSASAQSITLSTRVRLQAGSEAIAGFIITNPSGTNPKKVILRGLGPSLATASTPLSPTLANPRLELNGPSPFVTITNNDWKINDLTGLSQEIAINATLVPPTEDEESAILVDLNPGSYTAVLRGLAPFDSDFARVEIYDLDHPVGKLANISTRAFVGTNDDIVIAGFTLDSMGSSELIVVRGLGPSLAALGVPNVLADPTLELRDTNGMLFFNDNWQDDPTHAAIITATGLAPENAREAAIAMTLAPGDYTALLAGLINTTGNGLVEVYDVGPP